MKARLLQLILRVIFIPWVIAISVVIGLYSSEQYRNTQFIAWIKDSDTITEHQIYLESNRNYRLVIFVQQKEMFDESVLKAKSEILSTTADTEKKLIYGSTGKTLTEEGSITRLLGSYSNKLQDDHIIDPYNHNKFIRSTQVFSIENTGQHVVRTEIFDHVDAWKTGLLLNTNASSLWTILLIILSLYFPIFIFGELYYFIQNIWGQSKATNSRSK